MYYILSEKEIGRTNREFIRQLALKNGYILNLKKVSPKETLEASIESIVDTSKLEKNITTKYEIAKDGKVIALMKNSNNKDVKIKLETVFYDESNNPIGNDSNYLDLAANQETPRIIYNAPKTGFAKCEFNIEINEYNSFYEDCSEDFAIKDNDTERGLVVQATNNSSKTADTLKVIVIFYQNGKIVGSGLESEYDLDSGKTATFTITHPHDNNYKDVTYDSYKIYITASAEN